MSEDQRLLREYVVNGSRQALEELIRRHLPLVYSSARRQVRNAHLAEDVTQAVFLVLTQKARTIRSGVALGGWLMTVTRFASLNAMRKQSIHRMHESLAAKPEASAAVAEQWRDIAAQLDVELNHLGRVDRDAVVLRFFQERSFAEIGAELGLTEDAARKRVARALDRLRARLDRKKASISAGALSMAIGVFAVQAVPTHVLAGTIAASTGSAAPQCISLAKGPLKMLAWTKAKIVATVAALLVVGTTSVVLIADSTADQSGSAAATPQATSTAVAPAPAAPAPVAAAPAPSVNVPAQQPGTVSGSVIMITGPSDQGAPAPAQAQPGGTTPTATTIVTVPAQPAPDAGGAQMSVGSVITVDPTQQTGTGTVVVPAQGH
jgi:RNA polymerase sigma factor (sigma-70 family)